MRSSCKWRVDRFLMDPWGMQPRDAHHLYGKPGNYRENSNGTVHPGGNFPGKKVIPFEVKYFCRFYRNDRIFLYHLFGLLVPVFTQRKRKLYRYFVNGTTQFRSCFRCQKNTSTIWPKFSTEIFVQMGSAPDHQCEIASCFVRSTCSHVMSHHLSYISYRQLANGPIRAASGAIVCWRSSFLFMYKDTGCPLIRDINMITLHCIAMRCVSLQCNVLHLITLHCTA